MEKLREEIVNWLFENITGFKNMTFGEAANQILALVKEAGYVKLADDQSVPPNPYGKQIEQAGDEPATEEDVYIMASNGFEKGISDMLRAGFRKVKA